MGLGLRLKHAIGGGQPPPTTSSGTYAIYGLAFVILALNGGMLANPTIDTWWRMGGIPPGISDDNELTQLYDMGLKVFDIGDLIFGAVFMIMKDVHGVAITLTSIGISLIFAYSVYIVQYGGETLTKILFIASTGIQGGVLNGIAICIFHIASLPLYSPAFKESIRFMILNGAFDVSTLFCMLLIDANKAGISIETEVFFLILSGIGVTLFAMLVLPKDVRVEEPASPCLSASMALIEQESEIKDVPNEKQKASFWKELCELPMLVFLFSWTWLAAIKVIINGPALSTAVLRQYGPDSIWMSFLQRFSWVGLLSGLVFGVLADYSLGGAYLFTVIQGIAAVWILAYESYYFVGLAVVLFFLMRGTVIGSLFFILPKILTHPKYEGRMISLFNTFAGLLLVIIVERLVDITKVPGEIYPFDKDYRPVLKILGYILIPNLVVTVWWSLKLLPKRMAALESLRR